ncbi:hypothetical protein D3C75_282170 [compost metagenome]
MDKSTAQTYWVWTDKAETTDPKRHRAGEMVWSHYAKEAPQKWLDDGLIVDSSEYVREGQMEIFDLLEG